MTVRGTAEAEASLRTAKRITLDRHGHIGDKTHCRAAPQEPPAPTRAPQSLPLNGPYTVDGGGRRPAPVAARRWRRHAPSGRFKVAAPPAKPVLDTPKVTDGRAVELSWSRNTEADMLYYVVFRTDPGGAKCLPVSGEAARHRAPR